MLTDDDVGIDAANGRPKIAKNVLDDMCSYLLVNDQTERQVRVNRVGSRCGI